MKTLLIQEKLASLGVDVNDVCLGWFDAIGKFCAERQRSPQEPLFKSCGAYYRSAYERGILAYYLVKQYKLTSFVEVGTGRGYVTFCVAKAFHDMGVKGRITTIDVAADENHFKMLSQVFPKEWFDPITIIKGPSDAVLKQLVEKGEKFDYAYIDGDHSYAGTKADWDEVKKLSEKVVVFDDYHLPTKNDPGIQCRDVIDLINEEDEGCNEKELVILDRRIFVDERKLPDSEINYGQVILTKKSCVRDDCDW